jgi:hypothetical protein
VPGISLCLQDKALWSCTSYPSQLSLNAHPPVSTSTNRGTEPSGHRWSHGLNIGPFSWRGAVGDLTECSTEGRTRQMKEAFLWTDPFPLLALWHVVGVTWPCRRVRDKIAIPAWQVLLCSFPGTRSNPLAPAQSKGPLSTAHTWSGRALLLPTREESETQS